MEKIKNVFLIFWQNPKYSMPLILLFWGVLYIFFGAVINKNNGLGDDGNTYGLIIKGFYNLVLNEKLNSYQIQRIFPLFLADLSLTILKLPKEDFYIIKYFQIYNLLLLILSGFVWNKISKVYGLNLIYTWLGFIFAFVNFGIAEMTFYYPVLLDTSAFFLGFCFLFFHIKDNLIGKIIITFIGAFTWPSFIYIGILLIIFPINSTFEFNFNNVNRRKSLNIYLAFLLPLHFFVVSIYNVNKYFEGIPFKDIFTPVFSRLLYIDSVLNYFLMVYFFYTILPKGLSFSNCYILVKKIIQNIKVKNILLSVLLFAIIFIIQKNLSNDQDPGTSIDMVIYYISLYSISKPFVYFVTSVTYFGTGFIILFFFLKHFKPYLHNLGIGVYLSFILSFILIFTTETRLIINFFPFIVLLTVLVIKNFTLNKSMLIWIFLFSLILSKVYIPMFNIPTGKEFFDDNEYFNFPNQLFYMNLYTISKLSYYINSIIILFMSIFIVFRIKRTKYSL